MNNKIEDPRMAGLRLRLLIRDLNKILRLEDILNIYKKYI